MNFREPSRPFDPTAMSLHNLIIAEKRPVSEQGKKIFVPSHGCFYSDSLSVYANGRPLVRGKDYRTLIHHPRATKVTGKEVSVCIQVINSSLSEIDITYQCVGGGFQSLFEIVKLIKETHGDQILRTILWHEIVDKPTTFNPAAHWHVVWDFKGWELLVTPLDKIRNAIIFKKQVAYRAVYDYYYAKMTEHKTQLDSRIDALRAKASDAWKRIRPPVGVIAMYKNGQTVFPDGNYVEMKNTLLYGVENDVDLLKTWGVSKDLVFQYPDNVLLNETEKPILQERDEWIYLDNEHPVSPLPTGEPYWEEIDELFDALCVKLYYKDTNGGEFDARLTIDKASIDENEVALAQVTTVGFAAGTDVMYMITGVGPTNVSVPLVGTVKLNSSGVGTLAIKLIADSPRTDSDTMLIEMMILGGLKSTLKYNLLSNQIQSTETTVHQYANGPLLTTPVVREDNYSLRINHRAVNGKTLTLKTSGLTATDIVKVGSNSYAGNAAIPIPIPVEGKVTTIPFTIKSRVGTSAGNVGLSITTPNGTVENIPMSVEPFAYSTLEFYDPETAEILTSIGYNRQFRIRVKQNSKDNPVVDLQFSGNTTSGQLLPTYIPPLFCKPTGIGESGTYVLMPTNGVAPTAGELKFTAVDPVTKSINIKATLQVTV